MRKGDNRRRAILDAAENLFYAHGFESTSVQDIIDALGFSKGGFYHHFESKLALLEAICEDRAQQSFDLAEAAVDQCEGNAADKLNAFFQKASMLQAGSTDFISLLVRVAYRDDGALMRERMKQRQLSLTLPLMDKIVREGLTEGTFFTPFPAPMGELVLRLGMQLTDEIAFLLATDKPGEEALVIIFEKLKLYRHSVETLLFAPYGSIVIFHLSQMEAVCRGVLKEGQTAARC
ncbi:MAG: TetR/AcrR family transcriptional regulator [Oscillospiraceae bacterium]|nr:TetR/AcrR family transcriptional regulator [Oscillospiraceae bacterium]